MSVRFQNYSHSFTLNKKQVFVPSELGRRIGEDVKGKVEDTILFEHYYYHLKRGGHVAALHSHRVNQFFCKIYIENFFYSISRNRVVAALRSANIARPEHYGKWSCVKNPYQPPSYSLPYGFVQSPILATLILATSGIGHVLRQISDQLTVAVYVDDISLSGDDPTFLTEKYHELRDAVSLSGFTANAQKCIPTRESLTIFNCSLSNQETRVTESRIEKFTASHPSDESLQGFERYCESVALGNRF